MCTSLVLQLQYRHDLVLRAAKVLLWLWWCSATYGGGGIKALQSAVVMTNCLIANNTSPAGAGLQTDREYSYGVVNDATFVLTGCTLSGNIATQTGGAMSAASMDLLSMSNVTFTHNIGMDSSVHARLGPVPDPPAHRPQASALCRGAANQGGALWFGGMGPNNLTSMTGCSFSDNSADYGGAIYASSGALGIISASTFTSNMAKSGGAAVLADDNSRLLISGCAFTMNGNNTVADPPLVSETCPQEWPAP